EVRGGMPEVSRRVEDGVSLTSEELTNHLVVGAIGGQPLLDPILKGSHGSTLHVELTISKPVFELNRPMRHIFRAFQKRIDEPGSLVGPRFLKKGMQLLRAGKDTDQVQVHSANEFAV